MTPIGNGGKAGLLARPYAAEAIVADLSADVVVFEMPGVPKMGLVWEGDATAKTVDMLGLTISATAHLTFAYEGEVPEGEVGEVNGRVHLPSGEDARLSVIQDVPICTLKGGCSCEEGSRRAGASFVDSKPGKAHIGITGHIAGAVVSVFGFSLPAFCQTIYATPRYVVMGGAWTWSIAGTDSIISGRTCTWSGSASGPITLDQNSEMNNYVEFDTTTMEVEYEGYFSTKGMLVDVTRDCPASSLIGRPAQTETFHQSKSEIWLIAYNEDHRTVSGDTISGTYIGVGPSRLEWSFTRVN